ncbi:MAG: 6-bladed beta-propeller [Gemmatimonadota bacterium]
MKTSFLIAALLAFTPAASAQQVTRIPAADKVIAGTPTQQFAIGAEDGEDWQLLSRVSGVAFDARENLYVLDAGNHRVLVFDANGKFLRKIGQQGGGPGELLSPISLAITRDGHIAVTDLGRAGVSLYKPDGRFVKNLMLGDSLGFPAVDGGTRAHPAGGVVVRGSGARMFRPDGPAPVARPTGPRSSPIVWLSSSGSPKQLFSATLPSMTPRVTENGGANGARNIGVRISPPAFMPPILWGMLPDGLVAVADEANYCIKLVSNGKVQRIIERAFPPRKVTEADKDRARNQRRQFMKTGTGMVMAVRTDGPGGGRSSIGTGGGANRPSDSEIEQMIREMTFLEYVPALQSMMVDPKGRLWLERTGRNYGDDGPIDIIDAAGRYVGTINGRMPDAFSANGRAAYIEKDDMDVEKVVVRRLPANWQ